LLEMPSSCPSFKKSICILTPRVFFLNSINHVILLLKTSQCLSAVFRKSPNPLACYTGILQSDPINFLELASCSFLIQAQSTVSSMPLHPDTLPNFF
jgi:hypothetical protein